MFGCCLPVAAVNFPALSELVVDGVNGKVFSDSDQLSDIIQDWFRDFSRDNHKYRAYRENIKEFRNLGWEQNWDEVALGVFQRREVSSSGFITAVMLCCVLLLVSSLIPLVH